MHPGFTCVAACCVNKPMRHMSRNTALCSHPQIIGHVWRHVPCFDVPPDPQLVCPHDITGSDTVSPFPAGSRCMLSLVCWWEVAS